MKIRIHNTAAALTLGALVLGGGFAQAAVTLPPIHKDGQVEYLSGGIGKDEASAIEKASKQWPLTLEFAIQDKKSADFAADVNVIVRDAAGHTRLKTTSSGPFVLAKLPPGHYAVEATLAGRSLHEKVQVKDGPGAKAVFVWPAGVDETHS